MKVVLDSIVARSAEVLEAEFEDEVTLLGICDGAYYGLRDTSLDIWRRISAPVSVRDLCADLAKAYAMPPEAVEADTLRFLERLSAMKVIEITG